MKVTIEATIHLGVKDLDDLKNATAEQVLATARMQGGKVTVQVEPDRPKKGKVQSNTGGD